MDELGRDILRRLWNEGPLSRWELHERTGRRPNSVGSAVATLIRRGMVRELTPRRATSGRPRVPLEIDPSRRTVVGLSIEPGRVEAVRLTLRGRPVGGRWTARVRGEARLRAAISAMVARLRAPRPLAVGIAIPGLFDPQGRRILLSSAWPHARGVDLSPVLRASPAPVTVANDMHALAARWLLSSRSDRPQDTMLVRLDDGAVGAAVLIDGRPNRGCLPGGNELGHTRFFEPTARCYCGQTGCLERICSTAFLRRCGSSARATLLGEALRSRPSPGLRAILRAVARALANAANFIRPHRVVLTGRLAAADPFHAELVALARRELLPALADRVAFERDAVPAEPVENAGWLALATLFDPAWNAATDLREDSWRRSHYA